MKDRNFLYGFLAFWLILNLITAVSTELYADEAYYWMYSNFPDWGYFDHPPGIAVVIHLTKILGKTELSVRLVNIVLSTISVFLIYMFIKPRDLVAFFAILFCSPILHITGFVTVPDGPFLFTSLLFLLAFKNFTNKESLPNVIFVGITSALMIYMKYDAFLIILFSILAVPQIFLNYKIYLAGLISLILIFPHIYWQIENDFPSLTYHLIDRGSSNYKVSQTVNFLTTNIFFLYGLISLVLLFFLIRNKSHSEWQRILTFNFYGTYIFFFLITFKGQGIEFNWTLPAFFPLLYLGYKNMENSKFFKTFKMIAIGFIPIMILMRVHLLIPLFEVKHDRVWDLHRAKQYVQKVALEAGDNIVSANRYQDASLLNFYGNFNYWVSSLNINSRANQYGIWKFEKDYCASVPDIIFLANHIQSDKKVFDRKLNPVNLNYIENVIFPNCLDYEITDFEMNDNKADISIQLKTQLENRYFKDFSLELYLLKDKHIISKFNLEFSRANSNGNELTWEIPVKATNFNMVQTKVNSKKLEGTNNQSIFLKL